MPEEKLVVKEATMTLKPAEGWSLVPPATSVSVTISTPSGATRVGGIPVAKESDLTGELASTITPIPYKTDVFTTPGKLQVTSITVTNNSGRGALTLDGDPVVTDAAEGTFQATFDPPGQPAKKTPADGGGLDLVPIKSGTWTIGDSGPTALTLA